MNPFTLTAVEEPFAVLQSTTGIVTSCCALAGSDVGGPELVQLLLLQEFMVTPDTGALIRASIASIIEEALPELPVLGVR
jgi:hypothetical protein